MKHYWSTRISTLVLAAACFAQSGWAQDSRVAVVDTETLTFNSDEGKLAAEKLKKRYDEIGSLMEKAQRSIAEKENNLKTRDRIMSASAKAQLTREIEDEKTAFNRKNEDYQREYTAFQEEVLGPISGKAQTALAAYIKEKGFTIVFDLAAEKGNIVWTNPGNDITLEVMKRLNEEFKRSGGAAVTPTASAPAASPAAKPSVASPAAAAPVAPKPPAASTPAPAKPPAR